MKSQKLFTLILAALIGLSSISAVHAQTYTYTDDSDISPGGFSAAWSDVYNWSGNTKPPTSSNGNVILPYSYSTVADYSLQIGSLTFNSTSNFALVEVGNGSSLTLAGSGITNASSSANFLYVDANGSQNTLNFNNSATVSGNVHIATSYGSSGQDGGQVIFNNSSSAGSSTIDNYTATGSSGTGGSATFFNTATAGSSVIDNHGGSASGAGGGYTFFQNGSTAGSATITNGGGTSGAYGGHSDFYNSSTAGSSTIYNNAGTNAYGGYTNFNDSTSAGTSSIYVNGGAAWFRNTSTAAQATLYAQSGSIYFDDTSTGGSARFVGEGGAFDISGLSSTGLTVGSIEGSGNYYLGSKNLTFGSLNTNTVVSAAIQDGGASGGTGGSLTKVGSGTTTLTGASTYTGSTTIDFGTLAVTGSGASINSGAVADFHVGLNSGDTGTLTVSSGGTVSDNIGIIGLNSGSSGSATVTGANSSWINGLFLEIGYSGSGTLTVSNGGLVSDYGGYVAGASSVVTVTGTGSTWNNSSQLAVGYDGAGMLTISNGGLVSVASGTGVLSLAPFSGSSGTLNIGNGGLAGTVSAAEVTGGPGTAAVNFGETDASYTFAPNLTGSLSVTQSGSGTTILTGSNTYTGGTTVNAGRLAVNGSVAGNVSVQSGGTLGGRGTVGGKVTVASGGSTYPGDPQILSMGSAEYQNGSTAQFAIATTSGSSHPPTPGTDYDQIKFTANTPSALQIDPGTTLQLNLSTTSLAVLQSNASNRINDLYFVFNLGSGTSSGQFSNLTLTEGANTYTDAIINGTATFAPLGIDLSLSYTASEQNNSLMGGNDVAFEVQSVPEPSTWAMLLGGVALLLFWRQRARQT